MGAADAVVLGAIAGVRLDGAVVALDGDGDLVDRLGVLEALDDVGVDVDEPGGALQLAGRDGAGRVRVRRHVGLGRFEGQVG